MDPSVASTAQSPSSSRRTTSTDTIPSEDEAQGELEKIKAKHAIELDAILNADENRGERAEERGVMSAQTPWRRCRRRGGALRERCRTLRERVDTLEGKKRRSLGLAIKGAELSDESRSILQHDRFQADQDPGSVRIFRQRTSPVSSSLLPDLPLALESSLVLETSPLEADECSRKRVPSTLDVGAMRKVSSRSRASDATYESNVLDVSADETDLGHGWTLKLRKADETHLDDLWV